MKQTNLVIFLIVVAGMLCSMGARTAFSGQKQGFHSQLQAARTKCEPTPADYLGPFYIAGAPVRASVGKGYELGGIVRSSDNCVPIANAKIELWLTNSEGVYDDDHRATIYSDDSGAYYFESNFPPGYSGRPSHIHIRISVSGFKTLATQHYPESGSRNGVFDIVLDPIR
jgi:protocatechuate 3,4-dioxygenase beta subunit